MLFLHTPHGAATRITYFFGRAASSTRSCNSLIESAKLAGVELRAYLREATLRAVRNPGTVTLARDLKSPEA